MRSVNRAVRLVLAVSISLGFLVSAHAQGFPEYKKNNEWNPTDAEVSQLPIYCQAQFRREQVRAKRPGEYGCGKGFNHFCPGLVALNRAANPTGTKHQRSFILGIAEQTLSGTQKNMLPMCPLAPDVNAAVQRARMLRLLMK